jgi:hypothetical protein
MGFLRSIHQSIFILAAVLSQSATGSAAQHITTDRVDEVISVIDQATRRYGVNRVLLAFDIDNTTLEFETDFGSEHWFLWQESLIKKQPAEEGAIATSIDQALDHQANIISLSPMKPVDASLPVELRRLGLTGVKMLALTSRGPQMRDATIREVAFNKFPYEDFGPGPRSGYPGTYLPYDLTRPDDYGLTARDIATFSLKTARPVIYDRGVFLTSGQHKGIMLRTLLQKTADSFDAIIFIDDRLKHSEAMQKAFEDRPEDLTTIHYTKTAATVRRFIESDKTKVIHAWCDFTRALQVNEGRTPRIPYLRPICE